MNRFQLILLLLVFAEVASSQDLPVWQNHEKEELELIGPVKTVEIRPYLITKKGRKGNKVEHYLDLKSRLSNLNSTHEFTRSGNVLAITTTREIFKANPTYPELEVIKIKCEYDAHENLIYYIQYDSLSTIYDFYDIDSLFYNEGGKPIFHVNYSFEGLRLEETWTYNSDGDLATYQQIQTASVQFENRYVYDKVAYKVTYYQRIDGEEYENQLTFNTQGKLISSIVHYPYADFIRNETRTYYSNGVLKEINQEDVYRDSVNFASPPLKRPKMIRSHVVFNENGDEILRETFDNAANEDLREVHLYNSQGLLVSFIRSRAYSGGTFYEQSLINYEYNAKNLCIAQKSECLQEGMLIVDLIEFDHDLVGNWIVKRCFRQGELVAIVERKITYY